MTATWLIPVMFLFRSHDFSARMTESGKKLLVIMIKPAVKLGNSKKGSDTVCPSA